LIQMAAYGEFALPNEKTSGLAGEEFDPNSPQDIILAIPASNYMEYAAPQAGVVQGKGTYTPRIYFTEKQGSVIGANAMQGHNVLFDRENGRVGFAESSCEYQEVSKALSGEGGVMSVDCRLGAPSLSVSCSESADLSRCRRIGSNSDTTLDGLEIWSRIVQSPGMPQGLTCEEVAAQQNEVSGMGQTTVLYIIKHFPHTYLTLSYNRSLSSTVEWWRRNGSQLRRKRHLQRSTKMHYQLCQCNRPWCRSRQCSSDADWKLWRRSMECLRLFMHSD
jgi:hypothetical protein